ncbi:MAG: hypothetical protein V3R66_04385 [Rhodospirillales bacterium]
MSIIESGAVLFILLAAILFLMWRRTGHFSIDRMLDDDNNLHHHVHRAMARRPHGATWRDHGSVMDEEKETGEGRG